MGAKLLSPLPTTMGTYIRLWGKLDDADFDVAGWQAMFRWVNEGVPFASAAYRQWITDFTRTTSWPWAAGDGLAGATRLSAAAKIGGALDARRH